MVVALVVIYSLSESTGIIRSPGERCKQRGKLSNTALSYPRTWKPQITSLRRLRGPDLRPSQSGKREFTSRLTLVEGTSLGFCRGQPGSNGLIYRSSDSSMVKQPSGRHKNQD